MNFREKETEKKTIYKGNIIDVYSYKVELPNGKEAPRDVVRHPGAVAVLPVDENGNIYLVQQFRFPINQELYEIPAGKIDIGEEHYECAVRELKEETGMSSDDMVYLGGIYTTPGFSDEIIHIYIAKNLSYGKSCPDEDEFLSVVKVTKEEFIKMISENKITDAKTLSAYAKALIYGGI